MYVHIIYIEDMRTKKALSAWIPLVSVFCSSGAVSGIRGKQMTPAVASERSIFSENHDYSFCKVGVINVSLVGGTRSLTCPFLDIQSNSFKKSGILNHVQVGNVRYGKE